jgi:hypothetical protein
MSGAIPPLSQYAIMAWCSVKKSAGTTLPVSGNNLEVPEGSSYITYLNGILFRLEKVRC